MNNFAIPVGLCKEGVTAYNTISRHLNGFQGLDAMGSRCFYSPLEWANRGERYGLESLLVVVYDLNDLRTHFSMDAAYEAKDTTYAAVESMTAALAESELFFEECTKWYSAIYLIIKGSL